MTIKRIKASEPKRRGIIQGLWLLPRMRGGRPYPHPPIQAVEQVAPAASSLRSRGYSACLNCGHTQLRSHSRRSHSSGHNRHDLGILECRTGTDAASVLLASEHSQIAV